MLQTSLAFPVVEEPSLKDTKNTMVVEDNSRRRGALTARWSRQAVDQAPETQDGLISHELVVIAA